MDSYAWDFGDGSTGTGVLASHSFAAGTWIITLTVTNDGGATATVKKQLVVSPSAAPGLVLHLKLDEEFADWSGRNHDVSWVGTPGFGQGRFGKGALLDGSDKGPALAVKHQADLDGMEQLTLALWAKKGLAGEANVLMHKHVTWRLDLLAAGFSAQVTNAATPTTLSVSQGGADTDWHHYAFTYDGANARLFLDSTERRSPQGR